LLEQDAGDYPKQQRPAVHEHDRQWDVVAGGGARVAGHIEFLDQADGLLIE
jgi:hypothetical protein